ncbi:TonB-dependent receptor domain-containing protein [Caulobacter sp. AP07]|uniref:TonB-dependent receptor domain-containing protein n=1 Tax=Caulobacter sp. AP07 TaxID=1144304 RepID=UPI0002E25741|nr:TonB-dependent receptor [Caulobacter sp. AP07]
MNHRFYACSASVLALLSWGATASAQEQAGAPAANDTSRVEEIVVTGSRIASRGFTQPTPTTTVTSEDLERAAQPNIFQAIVQMPALQGSTGRTTSANSTSSGIQGLSSLSLRGLGPIRTLTLLDGQRVTPANVTGVTDVSQFPQLLIKRVDVVTGGASASYGSDAIGGVVNFVTDKTFEGLKIRLEGGESKYRDNDTFVAQAAVGKAFLNDRLRVVASGEFSREAGVLAGDFGLASAGGRDWFTSPSIQVRPVAATTDGRPQYRVIQNAQQIQYTKYGLITNGPLQGIAFGPGGAPRQFQYGSNGAPTGTGAVTNCFNPFCVGGDLSGNIGASPTLAGRLKRKVAYGRVSYRFGDDDEIYLTTNVAVVNSLNQPNRGAEKAGLTIQCENPFVPAAIRTACATNNITSFQFGTSNGGFGPINVNAKREQERFVVGATGTREAFGTSWSYDAYYAYGQNRTSIDVDNISLTPRYNAAIDAIAGPNGTVICRDPVARANGCVPLNVIGQVALDPAALAYVMPANGPKQRSRQIESVASFNITGEPFSSWAGPIAIAAGAEWREEDYRTTADPYGDGVTAANPYDAAYPADPVVRASGNNWYAGNYHAGHGYYHVIEGYLEANVPILKSDSLGEANINGAVRQTKYSTAGNVTAWKLGGVWKTPVEGLRFRAVTSRDIRAPNLSELFAPPVVTNATVIYKGVATNVLQEIVGNTNLRPEIARNTEVGVVLSEPKWLPGFSLSVDYFDIKVDGAINSLAAQDLVDLCVAGNQEICGAMLLTSPLPNTNYVRVQSFNVASMRNKGVDIEAVYRKDLGDWGLPGSIAVRALATHTISFVAKSGVLGTIPVEIAGVNGGSSLNNLGNTPDWKATFSQTWSTGKLSLSLYERWISDGHYNNEYIECQTNCPVSTVQHRTIDSNKMKGTTYVDAGGTYDVNENTTAYFKVDNLFDKDPVAAPTTNVSPGVNPYLYDVIGRMYRLGVRLRF